MDLDCFWNYWKTVLEGEPQVEEDQEKEEHQLLLLLILKLKCGFVHRFLESNW
jgi:hypothetical protein